MKRLKSFNANTENTSLMKKLIKSYSVILIIIITIFAITVGYVTSKRDYDEAVLQNKAISQKMTEIIESYEQDLRKIVFDLFTDADHVQSMKDYFYMDLPTYYTQQLSQDPFIFFPKDIQKLYDRYDGIEGFMITLNNSNDLYYSHTLQKMGYKPKRVPNIGEQLMFHRILTNYDSYDPVGIIHLIADSQSINTQIDSINHSVPRSIYILTDNGKIKYAYTDREDEGLGVMLRQSYETGRDYSTLIDQHYLKHEVPLQNGNRVVVAVNRADIVAKSFKTYASVILGSIVLDVLLLWLLFRTFGRYSHQVDDILQSMGRVKDGAIDYRIPTEDKEDELRDISIGINETLDSISRYVEEIYQLEIRQQDINLRALQSQINPHFLYNTLEFIRMYAVSEGVDELADVVYTFASLLRNNISLEKTTTLAKELEFCEKYVYLHQMRYPNRVAYKFDIEPGLEQIIMPKFTMQPLIENYFVHGIDFGRVDNAIKVTAYREASQIVLEVSDNGKGMDNTRLAHIQKQIDESVFNINDHNSVGLLNVHERLKTYFSDSHYSMTISINNLKGFTVTMRFDEEGDKNV
ncbi:sensor histidine kinase [Erysipelothrix sp. strain 2 (EsS2-6-Brazil)]|uniref:sensor histidine kinase n=2 Tax=Erysipelothrix TaxID=1647 RepID=UPI001FCFDA04|nr:sensor histidine kinase [Erysipelothrix sp. strain 2 (EsS2-6-Brazil)]